ncbi:MAG TPA: carboxypeptidase-like regulatory domain-containing protein [Hymenobacter sp.]|nr:carboxypeptidase-like regulatory domain-containing protein [Hymenobacter sp.]
MRHRSDVGDATLERYHQLRRAGHSVKPIGWVQRQFDLIQGQSKRIRQRAASVAVGGVLLSGVVLAATNLPAKEEPGLSAKLPTTAESVTTDAADMAASNLAFATYTVSGRILNEEGKPLIGATVLDRATGQGVSTNSEGVYQMRVPQGRAARLQYAYAGYQEEELNLNKAGEVSLTLMPVEKQVVPSRLQRWWKHMVARR